MQENLSPGIQSMFLKLSYTGMIAAAERHDCCSRGLAHYSHVLSEGSGVVLNHKVLGSNPTGTWLRP